jgi:hypothetical protein
MVFFDAKHCLTYAKKIVIITSTPGYLSGHRADPFDRLLGLDDLVLDAADGRRLSAVQHGR